MRLVKPDSDSSLGFEGRVGLKTSAQIQAAILIFSMHYILRFFADDLTRVVFNSIGTCTTTLCCILDPGAGIYTWGRSYMWNPTPGHSH